MSKKVDSFNITTLFESPGGDDISNRCYRDVLLHTLRKILPADFFDFKDNDEGNRRYQEEVLDRCLPLIKCSDVLSFPGTISFFSLSRYRSSSFKFFFEMFFLLF